MTNAITITLRLWAIFSLGLHLFAFLLPETYFWSVWSFTQWPWWFRLVVVCVASLTLIPRINQTIGTFVVLCWQQLPGKARPHRWFALMSILALPLFWWGRIQHLTWGDAAILVAGLSHPELTVIYNWQAPLTVFLHQRLWALLFEPNFGWGVAQVYALVSVVSGGFFVFISLALAHQLGTRLVEKALIAGLILTSGSMQLFFGYVENYTLISVGIMLFLWMGLRVLAGQAPFWLPVLVLALTNAFHPSTVFLWPAVLYLGWWNFRQGKPMGYLLFSLLLPPLMVANSLLTFMELGNHGLDAFLGDDRPGGGDHSWFVPLFETESHLERYTMFSAAHWVEWLNEHYLISTFGLFIIGLAILFFWRTKHTVAIAKRPQLYFLSIASFCYVALTWLWNADYGVRKDWDLFSPSAFVYSVLAGYLLGHILKDEPVKLAEYTLFMVVVSGLHTASWVFANTQNLSAILGG